MKASIHLLHSFTWHFPTQLHILFILLPVNINCSLVRIFFVLEGSIFSNVLAKNGNSFLARSSAFLEGPKLRQFPLRGLCRASNRRRSANILEGGLAASAVKRMVVWSDMTRLQSGFCFWWKKYYYNTSSDPKKKSHLVFLLLKALQIRENAWDCKIKLALTNSQILKVLKNIQKVNK